MYSSVGPYNVHLVLYDGWRRRGEEHYSQKKVPDKAISIVPGPLFLECPTLELWWLGTGHVVRCPLTLKCQLGPATPSTPTTYAHLGQTLTPVCYRGHLPCSLLPLWCVTRLSSLFIIKIELENWEKSSSTSSFTICSSYYEMSSFASFESGVGRVLGGAGPPQYGIEH